MKLSALRPCDQCGGPLGLSFGVVRCSTALVSPRSAREVLGVSAIFGGALGLAEVMAPDADGAVVVLGDREPALTTELLLCMDCYATAAVSLAELMGRREMALERGGSAPMPEVRP